MRKISENMRYSKFESETKVTSSIPIETYKSTINLFASRCQMRNISTTTAKISKYHVLESKNTGQDICHKILNTDIGLSGYSENINFDSVTCALSPILELFKNRHNKFDYLDKLKYVIAKNDKKNAKQKYKCQIHVSILQYFFGLLLYKNVPLKLFGPQNLKIIKKTIYNLLKTIPKKILITRAFKRTMQKTDATGASFDMQPLFKKFNIFKIQWLHSINSNTEQWIIILKLLNWFFTQYIIKILHKYVVLIPVKNQWVYFVKDDWCNMQKEFLKEKESTLSFVPWTPVNSDESRWHFPIGICKFILSSSGLRPLFIQRYDAKEKFDDVDVVLRYLQQLYVTYINKKVNLSVIRCKQEAYKFKNLTKNRLYYVRCDIQDAFGSIIQEKLFDIITIYHHQLPMYLRIRTYTLSKIKKRDKNNRGCINKTQTVQFLDLKRLLHKRAVISKEKPRLVKKTKLFTKIKKILFEQKIELVNQIYSVKLGVPQGMQVSQIFCDIYYQYMHNEMFSQYASNGFLCRYVDDILYITENEHSAAKFLEIVRNGIPEYNVKFNPSKTLSNVGRPYRPKKIEFLGWTIKL